MDITSVISFFFSGYGTETLTFNSKYMLGPHLFKFRQLLCSSTTYHVMLKVKLFRVIPQKPIPQKACIEGILFLLIPNALLQKKDTLSLTNTAPVNSFNEPLNLLHICLNFTWHEEGSKKTRNKLQDWLLQHSCTKLLWKQKFLLLQHTAILSKTKIVPDIFILWCYPTCTGAVKLRN